MKPLIAPVAVLATAAIAIAGCGGGSNNETAAGSGASAATGSGTTVSSQKIGSAGNVLVDSTGMALYAPAQEKSGKILCTKSCTAIWKPVTIPSGTPSGPGNLGVIMRPDGTRQVTSGGMPLYTFAQDQAGQVTGNGAKDSFGGHSFTWHVITSKGAPAAKTGGSSGGSSGGGAYGSSY